MHTPLKPIRRNLVSFHPKLIPHSFADVVVIGSGLAGLRAALAVDPKLDVLLVCKSNFTISNSVNAQGGIASVWEKTDSFEDHIEDTLLAGGELCDKRVVDHVIKNGPAEVLKLIEYGVNFDRSEDECDYALAREGGHSHSRVLHAFGDSTGKEIIRGVLEEANRRPNIRLCENTFVIDLLTSTGKCRGCIVYHKNDSRKELIWAKQTIIATGGIGQLYRETTNPETATGDGIAIAYRAGAEVRDMEFIQFHPTVLYIAGSSRSLISEALRGAGATLVDKNGYRFMYDYDPRGELAPRDVVSRSIVMQMMKTNSVNVFLDLSHKEPEWVYNRFPGIAEQCRLFDIDIATDRIPVRPGTHYIMGGITIDIDGRTTLPGLWAAGECAASGLHGANRLASNSLLEALVFGESCGRLAGEAAAHFTDDYNVQPVIDQVCYSLFDENFQADSSARNLSEQSEKESEPSSGIDLADLRNALKSLMWRCAGVIRSADSLQEALDDCRRWSNYVLSRQFDSVEGWELQNMLLLSQLVLKGALLREETRGAHNRSDFPEKNHDLDDKHFTFTQLVGG
ncbi:MAG: L-aspartate oxidase [Thermoguttaceae bacterium]